MKRPRWILTITVAVVAVGVAVWATFFDSPPEKCKPVIELLEFNQSQAALVKSKDGDWPPTVAEDAVFQQWADGLAERAQKVNDPGLAAQATELAQLANQFVTDLPRLREETRSRAPGAPTPVVVYQMSSLNDRITQQVAQLSKACS